MASWRYSTRTEATTWFLIGSPPSPVRVLYSDGLVRVELGALIRSSRKNGIRVHRDKPQSLLHTNGQAHKDLLITPFADLLPTKVPGSNNLKRKREDVRGVLLIISTYYRPPSSRTVGGLS